MRAARLLPHRTPVLTLLKRAGRDFLDDECPVRAAALAWYTIFAPPPLLVLLLLVAGLVWDPEDIRRAMEGQFASLVGTDGARAIHDMISQADRPGGRGALATILGTAGLLFGATGAFMQLQTALNRAWEVQSDPAQGGVRTFLRKRLLSLGMILGIAFLLVVSLAFSTVLSLLGERLGGAIPEAVLHGINAVVTFAALTVVFAAMYRVLPDAEIGWRDVWVGALATSVLFVAGKFALGLYLGRSDPGQAFGAASALAVILLWVYYAGMIVLFGAEFTQAWAQRRGRGIRPERGAIRLERSAAPRGRATARDTRSTAFNERRKPMQRQDVQPRRTGRVSGNGDGRLDGDASVGELFGQLSRDGSHLLRQEIALARVELRESVAQLARGAGKLGVAAGLAIPGLLAFTAFLVIGIGDWIENYWASALIVSVVFLALAAWQARSGLSQIRAQSLAPRETIGTLREDADWAKDEAQAFKRELTASHSRGA